MSSQTVLSFIAKADTDTELQQQIKDVSGDLPALLAIAAKAGYPFTRDDWTTTMNEIAQHASGQLGQAELDRVSGGVTVEMRPSVASLGRFSTFIVPNVAALQPAIR
jgi:predicted ribosomally synthesized peptide with nif11-like leader